MVHGSIEYLTTAKIREYVDISGLTQDNGAWIDMENISEDKNGVTASKFVFTSVRYTMDRIKIKIYSFTVPDLVFQSKLEQTLMDW